MRLHQAIGDRIEPKLPIFECEGVITESDGSSGVILMRTLKSYLADLLPELSSFIVRICSGYAPRWGVLRTQSV
jgi:hypothetical protein